jgi:hypothetical protein
MLARWLDQGAPVGKRPRPSEMQLKTGAHYVRWIRKHMTANDLKHCVQQGRGGFFGRDPKTIAARDRPTQDEAIEAVGKYLKLNFTGKNGEQGGKLANFMAGKRGSSNRIRQQSQKRSKNSAPK